MTRLTCCAGLLALLALSAEGRAGGPPPLCLAVDKILLEPSEEAPDRIQIWGTFLLMEASKGTYGAPLRGYLYYTIVPGKEQACRKEWAELRKLVAEDKIVALGMCGVPKVDGHVRKPTEKRAAPLVFPLCDEGFAAAELRVDRRFLTALLTSPAPLTPADNERLPPGKVTLAARNIRAQEHGKAQYVFTIENSAGEQETSPPIAARDKHAVWSPKMTVNAGENYTWRVRATEGTWQGPSASASFRGKERS